MGIERLVLLLETLDVLPESVANTQPDVYVMVVGHVSAYALNAVEQLREACPKLRFFTHCGGGSFKSQMKKADKSMAAIAIVIGEDECANEQLTIKFMRDEREQQTVSLVDAIKQLNKQ